MNHEIAKRWVAALRSGKYKQGKHFLVTLGDDDEDNRYCCLGVLCEILGDHRPDPGYTDSFIKEDGSGRRTKAFMWFDRDTHGRNVSCFDDTTLPMPIREIAEMRSKTGEYSQNGISHSLAGDNDSRGYNFGQIADVIEREINVL